MRKKKGVPPAMELDLLVQRQPPGVLGWVVLAAGVLAVLGVLVEQFDLNDTLSAAQQRLARQQHAAQRASDRSPASSRAQPSDTDLRRAAQIAQELQRPWLAMLADIEAADDEEVALLAVEPAQAREGHALRLTGEGRSLEAALAYARRLQARPGLEAARIESYEPVKSGGAGAVVFRLSARWKAAS
jgi:hypothetical protein